eukprot:2477020-Rhodomonas_salina.2
MPFAESFSVYVQRTTKHSENEGCETRAVGAKTFVLEECPWMSGPEPRHPDRLTAIQGPRARTRRGHTPRRFLTPPRALPGRCRLGSSRRSPLTTDGTYAGVLRAAVFVVAVVAGVVDGVLGRVPLLAAAAVAVAALVAAAVPSRVVEALVPAVDLPTPHPLACASLRLLCPAAPSWTPAPPLVLHTAAPHPQAPARLRLFLAHYALQHLYRSASRQCCSPRNSARCFGPADLFHFLA